MPNDCINYVTITCKDEEVINTLISEKLELNKYVKIIKRGSRGIIFEIWSPWIPDYKWLESLLEKYPNCWIKNEWHEEGGLAGVWIGYLVDNEKIIKKYCWNDLSIEDQHYLFLEKNETSQNSGEQEKIDYGDKYNYEYDNEYGNTIEIKNNVEDGRRCFI